MLRTRARSSAGSALDVLPAWLPSGALRLPPGLVNASVRLNSSLRALHTARVAVRLFAALAELLRDRPTLPEEVPVSMAYEERLGRAADCLQTDLDGMPTALKSGFVHKPVRWKLLDQTLALALAHSGLEVQTLLSPCI